MSNKSFDFLGGALCLDFANTVDWRASDHPQDQLADLADVIDWGTAAGILDAAAARRARELAAKQPAAATAAFAHAVALRDAVYRVFVAAAEAQPVDPADLTLLNASLREALPYRQIIAFEDGFGWDWREKPADLDQVRRAVAHSAGGLLTGPKLDRVRQCADDRGCGYLFVDSSRNRSRRWCSMETCGNRAKVLRHYRRQQEDGA